METDYYDYFFDPTSTDGVQGTLNGNTPSQSAVDPSGQSNTAGAWQSILGGVTGALPGIAGLLNANNTTDVAKQNAKAQAALAQQKSSSLLMWGLIGGGVIVVLVIVGLMFGRSRRP